ncbi:hypothetical protein NQX30_05605 [Candidatus Persebacteraceae bacterium Df01]|jgi:hypothetical protein|uniref:Uncharacterized protein n=1 Tax=Candidatus Doriopsillibacter californiensis TaxID=2970740 RepID=A0ABT7QMC2_9GAMM|nr:hypothetical protein [Candidatus Persebacteraceae bacterium Df01]
MTTQAHQQDNRLSQLAIAYSNMPNSFIAEQVAMRTPANKYGQYQKFSDGSFFQAVETRMAYGARAQEIVTASSLEAFSLDSHGVDAFIDRAENRHVSADRERMNLLEDAALQSVLATMRINHEVEVRDVVFDTTNYASALQFALAGGDQFDNDASDPIKTITNAIKEAIARPNVAVCGMNVAHALRSNPNINKAVHRTNGDAGYQSLDSIAMVLGLDKIIVGEAWAATSDNTAPTSRIWDSADTLALVRVGVPTDLRCANAAAFAVTATEHGGMIVRKWNEDNRGPEGGTVIRPVDCRKVIHLSEISGAIITNCLT